MKYEYKVIWESDSKYLAPTFNQEAQNGWRVISVVWAHDENLFVATLERAK